MKISVIIPTLNAASYLPELLIRLQRQTHSPHEIIVVDSSSDDKSVQIAKDYNTKVMVIERSSFDHGGTRNYAASHATGDVFVFMTQDALPADDSLLEQLISPMVTDSNVAATFGRQIVGSHADPLERISREFNYPPVSIHKSLATLKFQGIKTFFSSDVCSAVRREQFQAVGGFHHPIVSNEDMLLTAKFILKGNSVVYAAEAKVIHSHKYTLVQHFRRYFDIGVSLGMNRWILQHATSEGEGRRLLKAQLRILHKERKWHVIPRLFTEASAKYAGYWLGLHSDKLPRRVQIYCSMHRFFWSNLDKKKIILGQSNDVNLSEKKVV